VSEGHFLDSLHDGGSAATKAVSAEAAITREMIHLAIIE